MIELEPIDYQENAIEDWRDYYQRWNECRRFATKRRIRKLMKRIRREAALERKLAAAERSIDTLAALVRLKYGNLYPEVNQILEDVGHGWPK